MTLPSASPFLEAMNWVEGTDPLDAADFMFWCPGCESHHGLYTTHKNREGGQWRIDLWSPLTVSPSVLCFHYRTEEDRKAKRNRITDCHLFIKAGRIEFLRDSKHKLAGQTVPMVPCKF